MPVKRRRSKARPGEAKAWSMYMQAGRDFFGALSDAGIVAPGENPSDEIAAEVWQRIGRDIVDHIERLHDGFPSPNRPFWAEERFGVV